MVPRTYYIMLHNTWAYWEILNSLTPYWLHTGLQAAATLVQFVREACGSELL